MHTADGPDYQTAARLLADAARVAVLTGAGVSAESGVPTFRGAGGFWRGRSALDLATPQAFARDPAGVWEFYRFRIAGLEGVRPNPGHRALVRLEEQRELFWLVTQNVDGLHRAAGSRNVVELHGSLARARCSRCEYRCASRDLPPEGVPACPVCGAHLRPAVVWFGEMLPDRELALADEAVRECDLLLVIGTSGIVEPAASFARRAALRGAGVVEVNVEPTPLSRVADVTLLGPAGVVLPRLVEGTG